MTLDTITDDFKHAVCEGVRLRRKGADRYAIHVPFTFPDGDHYVIVLRKAGDSWYLTDEGHTLMHLSYKVKIDSPIRAEHIDTILTSCGVQRVSEALRIDVTNGAFGDALFSLVQAISQMVETARWTFERARSTFAPEFASFVRKNVPTNRLTENFTDTSRDPRGLYTVDYRIGNQAKELYVFGLASDDACRDATISIHEHRAWGRRFITLAVFDNQLDIDPKVLARFTDAQQGRTFSSLMLAAQTAPEYIQQFLAHALPEQAN